MSIHQSAFVDPRADIRAGADIGAGAVIGVGADIGAGADKPEIDFAARAAEFRSWYPDIPVIANLDAAIAEAIGDDTARLDMSTWHTCETTHCRAGWAIHLAGAAGKALENKIGSAAAGGFIYRVSAGYWPNFYASDAEALADIRAGAARVEAK